MKKKFLLLTSVLACAVFLFTAIPAAAVTTVLQDSFYISFFGMEPTGNSGGTGWPGTVDGVWFQYDFDSPYNDWSEFIWNQWFYDHPTVIDYYKIIEYGLSFSNNSNDAYAEIWINWSTPEWSPNPNSPPLPGADVFIERELVYTYTYVPEPVFSVPITTFIIPDYNPEWISIDIIGYDVFVSGTIWHECLPQNQVPLPAAGLLFGSGLLGIAGLKRKFLG